jgi:predicted metal-dependent phosphoesterase TrpH
MRLDRERKFDLHLHTNRSDGVLGPEELLDRCAAAGLDVVAITDHDLATDLAFGRRRVGGRDLLVLPGAEVSGIHAGVEHHLLVYFPDEAPASFHRFCEERCRERAERYEASRENIGLPGVPAADVDAVEGRRSLTRHHLARSLVEAGHARDVREAFRRFADDASGNVPAITLPFVDAIRIARSCGGVTSWAHPPMSALEQHLDTFVAAGLQGLEGIRPLMTSHDRNKVRRLARRHGLFLTGGSDWHGWPGSGDCGLFHVERVELGGLLAALESAA